MQSVGWLYDEKMRSVKPRTLFHVINECAQTELMSHLVNDSMPRLFHQGQLLPPFNHIFPMHTQIHTFFITCSWCFFHYLSLISNWCSITFVSIVSDGCVQKNAHYPIVQPRKLLFLRENIVSSVFSSSLFNPPKFEAKNFPNGTFH